jgi:hypothetical protein
MRLIVDISNVQFQVTSNPKEKTDQAGKQKFNVDGLPMWTTQVLAQDGENGEVLQVSVAGAKPSVAVGQQVRPLGLEAIPWNNNGKHGVAFRATEIRPASASGK